MTYKHILILIFLSFGFTAESLAQSGNYLVLKKENSRKRIRYFPGDEFQFIVKDSDFINKFMITQVTDSAIFGGTDFIKYNQIQTIYIPKKDYFIIPNKGLLGYGVSILGSYGIVQLAYLINTGSTLHQADRNIPFLLLPIPVLYISNLIKKKTVKKHYNLSPGNYILNPVLLDLQPTQ